MSELAWTFLDGLSSRTTTIQGPCGSVNFYRPGWGCGVLVVHWRWGRVAASCLYTGMAEMSSLKLKTAVNALKFVLIPFSRSLLTSFGKLTELTGKHSWAEPRAWALMQTRDRPRLGCGGAPVLTDTAGKEPMHSHEHIASFSPNPSRDSLRKEIPQKSK